MAEQKLLGKYQVERENIQVVVTTILNEVTASKDDVPENAITLQLNGSAAVKMWPDEELPFIMLKFEGKDEA